MNKLKNKVEKLLAKYLHMPKQEPEKKVKVIHVHNTEVFQGETDASMNATTVIGANVNVDGAKSNGNSRCV